MSLEKKESKDNYLEVKPARKITRKNSSDKRQKHGDCWLYTACTLTTNYFIRFDLEQNQMYSNYNSLFANMTEECELKMYTSFGFFVRKSSQQEVLELYIISDLCHSEILYNYLFYFFYYIAMRTESTAIKSGNILDVFEFKLLKCLKNNLFSLIANYREYLLSRIDSNQEVLLHIIHILYLFLQRHNLCTDLLNCLTFDITNPTVFDDSSKMLEMAEIVSRGYIGFSYRNYINPDNIQTLYRFPCVGTPHRTLFTIGSSEQHSVVIEEFIPSSDADFNNWSLVFKEWNSACRGIITREQMKFFSVNVAIYLQRYPITISSKIKLIPAFTSEYRRDFDLNKLLTEDKSIWPNMSDTISVNEREDIWSIIQKLINEKLHFLLPDYNIFIKPVLGPMKPERVTVIIKKIPLLELTDYDTEVAGVKKRKKTLKQLRRKYKKKCIISNY